MQMATSIETDTGEMIVKRVSVPVGLEELMEGLTKEVLLKKPKDIYLFASEYFAHLLNLREKGSLKATLGKRAQSVTKQIPANNLEKNLKTKSNSVDAVKNLSRQFSLRSNSSSHKTLTTKKMTLEDKNAEKAKSFLNKRKARKDSKDNSSTSTSSSKPQSNVEKSEKKTSRFRDRSVNKDEQKKTPRKRSQEGIKQEKSSSKSKLEEKNKEMRKHVTKTKNEESSTENKIEDMKKDVEIIDNKNQEKNNCIGCSIASEKATDIVAIKNDNKIETAKTRILNVNEEIETPSNNQTDSNNNKETDNTVSSIDEVDSNDFNKISEITTNEAEDKEKKNNIEGQETEMKTENCVLNKQELTDSHSEGSKENLNKTTEEAEKNSLNAISSIESEEKSLQQNEKPNEQIQTQEMNKTTSKSIDSHSEKNDSEENLNKVAKELLLEEKSLNTISSIESEEKSLQQNEKPKEQIQTQEMNKTKPKSIDSHGEENNESEENLNKAPKELLLEEKSLNTISSIESEEKSLQQNEKPKEQIQTQEMNKTKPKSIDSHSKENNVSEENLNKASKEEVNKKSLNMILPAECEERSLQRNEKPKEQIQTQEMNKTTSKSIDSHSEENNDNEENLNKAPKELLLEQKPLNTISSIESEDKSLQQNEKAKEQIQTHDMNKTTSKSMDSHSEENNESEENLNKAPKELLLEEKSLNTISSIESEEKSLQQNEKPREQIQTQEMNKTTSKTIDSPSEQNNVREENLNKAPKEKVKEKSLSTISSIDENDKKNKEKSLQQNEKLTEQMQTQDMNKTIINKFDSAKEDLTTDLETVNKEQINTQLSDKITNKIANQEKDISNKTEIKNDEVNIDDVGNTSDKNKTFTKKTKDYDNNKTDMDTKSSSKANYETDKKENMKKPTKEKEILSDKVTKERTNHQEKDKTNETETKSDKVNKIDRKGNTRDKNNASPEEAVNSNVKYSTSSNKDLDKMDNKENEKISVESNNEDANKNQEFKEKTDTNNTTQAKEEKVSTKNGDVQEMTKENKSNKEEQKIVKSKDNIKIKNSKSKSLSQENLKTKDEKAIRNVKRIKSVDLINKNQLEATKSKTFVKTNKQQNEKLNHKTTKDLIVAADNKNVRIRRSTSADVKETNLSKTAKQTSFDSSKLREELKQVDEISKVTTFKTSYNPYILRQEIKQVSQSQKSEEANVFEKIATDVAAAIRIQSVWRGFIVRKRTKKLQSNSENEDDTTVVEEIKQAIDKSKFEEKSGGFKDIAKDVAAAIRIQAVWRGFLVRKKNNKLFQSVIDCQEDETKADKEEHEQIEKKNLKETSEKIKPQNTETPGNDSGFENIAKDVTAAIKIQSMWKKFLSRKRNKNLHQLVENHEKDAIKAVETNKEIEKKIVKHTSDQNKIEDKSNKLENIVKDVAAAIKIQSIWRGFRVRKKTETSDNSVTWDENKSKEIGDKKMENRREKLDPNIETNNVQQNNTDKDISENDKEKENITKSGVDDEKNIITSVGREEKLETNKVEKSENKSEDDEKVDKVTNLELDITEKNKATEFKNKSDDSKTSSSGKVGNNKTMKNVERTDLESHNNTEPIAKINVENASKQTQIKNINKNATHKKDTSKGELTDKIKLTDLDTSSLEKESMSNQKDQKKPKQENEKIAKKEDKTEEQEETKSENKTIQNIEKQNKKETIDNVTEDKKQETNNQIKQEKETVQKAQTQLNENIAVEKNSKINLSQERENIEDQNTQPLSEIEVQDTANTVQNKNNTNWSSTEKDVEEAMSSTVNDAKKETKEDKKESSLINKDKTEQDDRKEKEYSVEIEKFNVKNGRIKPENDKKSASSEKNLKRLDDADVRNQETQNFAEKEEDTNDINETKNNTTKLTGENGIDNIRENLLQSTNNNVPEEDNKTDSKIKSNKERNEEKIKKVTENISDEIQTVRSDEKNVGSSKNSKDENDVNIENKKINDKRENQDINSNSEQNESKSIKTETEISKIENNEELSSKSQNQSAFNNLEKLIKNKNRKSEKTISNEKINEIQQNQKPDKETKIERESQEELLISKKITTPEKKSTKKLESEETRKPISLADAVLKIQAVWRGFRVRKQFEKVFGTSVKEEVKNKEELEVRKMDKNKAVSKIQALWRGYKVRKGIREFDKKLSEQQQPAECDELPWHRGLSEDAIFKAASKIQAGVRGYMIRKKGTHNKGTLKSITEEPTDENLSDEQVLEALNSLQEIPEELPIIKTEKNPEKSVSLTSESNKPNQSRPILNKNELGSNLEKPKESIKATTGNEISKNNTTESKEDNKTTENDVEFIAGELNSSTTNKLSNSNSAPLIDDSISNGVVNKDEVDPISREEPGYEDAPTRPATSNKAEDDKENKQTGKNAVKVEPERFLSQKSTNSGDSIATVIRNDDPKSTSEEMATKKESSNKSNQKLSEDKAEALLNAVEDEEAKTLDINAEIAKMSKSVLEEEIENYNKHLQEMAAKNYEEFIDTRTAKNQSNDVTNNKLKSELKNNDINNKLNKASLETEIEKFSKHLQKETTEKKDISTETKSEKHEENPAVNNTKTEKEILRVHIPLRELSDIKEEDADDKSPMDTSKNLEIEKEEKTSQTSQKSSTTTISLVHSGELHDAIAVPIPVTPPTRASPEGGKAQQTGQTSPQGLVNTGELHDNVVPLSVQLNEAPPGAEVLTSHVSNSITTEAQASNKDASTCETQPDKTTPSSDSMETEKRNNASIQKKSMEAEAATKIQAGFRGYQVRKQLKNKISAPGDISNQRRSARRKSSGRLTDSGRITQNKSKSPSDIEEKSAVKIQAGVRGFLVRRRQKKQNQGKESS
ncbi:uncharacterized protein PF11_0213-like isoform X2 [Tribolium madens]|uniref:uncharacterized protein PF11_0213-like isoform X2 n=1 Tax=Tribolium madens TaxID=41895 RepID=UPI001CF74E51|nr:uncharacterized protein PF11_0213-like isoform X2 [Tribolium madens]